MGSVVAGCLFTSDFSGVAGVRPGADDGNVDVDDGSDGAISPCASGQHALCNDFDHPGGGFPIPGWNNETGDAGELTLDDTAAVTSPLSLHAKVTGKGGTPQAYLYRTVFLPAFTALTVSVDLRIVACPAPGNSVTVLYVEPSAKASFGFAFLGSGAQAVGAGVNGAFTFFTLAKQIPDQVWSHVVYRIMVKNASTAHLTLTVDGSTEVDTDAPSSAMQPQVLLNLGLLGTSAPKGCELQFDNYVLDQE